MIKAVAVLSGGMDSSTAVLAPPEGVQVIGAVTVHYGQRHEREIEAAAALCAELAIPHRVIGIDGFDVGSALTGGQIEVPEGHYEDANMKKTVVPNRNMILISLATAVAIDLGADAVMYGAHAGDHAIYPDCRPEFVASMREAMKLCDYRPIELLAPFESMSKGDIVKHAVKRGVHGWLGNTWTCYNGREHHCGRCGACVERREAFEYAGIEDPTIYEEAVI